MLQKLQCFRREVKADTDEDRCARKLATYKLKARNGRKLLRKQTKSITVEGIGKKQRQHLKLTFKRQDLQSREEITP